MIHFFNPESMAYTACYRLTQGLWTTVRRSEVTCQRCLGPWDAEGYAISVGHLILLPNGQSAVVTEIAVQPLPEVIVVYRGEQVRILASEVVLL